MDAHINDEAFIKIKICVFCVKICVLMTCCLLVLVIIWCISVTLQLKGAPWWWCQWTLKNFLEPQLICNLAYIWRGTSVGQWKAKPKKNASSVVIWKQQWVLYMKSYIYIYTYMYMIVCHWILLEIKNVLAHIAEKIITHIFHSITFFRKTCLFFRKCGKIWYSLTGSRRQYKTVHCLWTLDM
jgi:hypothetical protein